MIKHLHKYFFKDNGQCHSDNVMFPYEAYECQKLFAWRESVLAALMKGKHALLESHAIAPGRNFVVRVLLSNSFVEGTDGSKVDAEHHTGVNLSTTRRYFRLNQSEYMLEDVAPSERACGARASHAHKPCVVL